MKIISGKLKGRTINGYDIEGTRPTMDRVKESVFATIQNKINGSIVLDLFAGSGNYGFEAYSNGARYVYLNDYNKECFKVINNNINKFDIKNYFKTTNYDYLKALKYYTDNKIKFDLVFLDPPYKMHVCKDIMQYMRKNDLLSPNALIISEVSENYFEDEEEGLLLIKLKKYGDKYVFIYKNTL